MIQRGDLVRVLPAYSMETRSRSIHDEVTGTVCTVVGLRPTGDALLVRGDVRAELPDACEADFAVHHGRCSSVLADPPDWIGYVRVDVRGHAAWGVLHPSGRVALWDSFDDERVGDRGVEVTACVPVDEVPALVAARLADEYQSALVAVK